MAEKKSSVTKAISILKSFTPSNCELGVSEIARLVGFPKSTIHRLLVTLTEAGLLEQSRVLGKYKVGPDLYILGSQYLKSTDILKAAEPVVKKLNDITEEAVIVGIVKSVDMTVIMKEEAKHALRYTNPVGTSVLAHASATGKALLSELTEEEIDKRFPSENLRQVTARTISTKTELKKDLENIRKTGVSIDIEGTALGVVGIASVIREPNGKAAAAISIPTPLVRLDPSKIEKMGRLVKLGASLISYRMGYQDSDTLIHNVDELREWWEQNKENSRVLERALSGEK